MRWSRGVGGGLAVAASLAVPGVAWADPPRFQQNSKILGTKTIEALTGGLWTLSFVLVGAALIGALIGWSWASVSHNPHLSGRFRMASMACGGIVVLLAALNPIMSWLSELGGSLQ